MCKENLIPNSFGLFIIAVLIHREILRKNRKKNILPTIVIIKNVHSDKGFKAGGWTE